MSKREYVLVNSLGMDTFNGGGGEREMYSVWMTCMLNLRGWVARKWWEQTWGFQLPVA